MEKRNFETIKNMNKLGAFDNKMKYDNRKLLSNSYVFDENITVAENRKRINDTNNEILNNRSQYNEEDNRLYNLFKKELINVLIDTSNNRLNEKQANIIFNKAWQESHSGGYGDIIINAETQFDFIMEIINV